MHNETNPGLRNMVYTQGIIGWSIEVLYSGEAVLEGQQLTSRWP